MKKLLYYLMIVAMCVSFVGCGSPTETEGLLYELDDQSYVVTGYGGEDKQVYIPDTKEGIKVEKINFEAFEDSEVEKVVLGNNITWIDLYAFKDCKYLKEINLSNKLDTIRGWAFSGCTSIKEIVIPESCWFIGYQAFAGWDSSQKIIIEGSTDSFEDGWDENCSAEIILKK